METKASINSYTFAIADFTIVVGMWNDHLKWGLLSALLSCTKQLESAVLPCVFFSWNSLSITEGLLHPLCSPLYT
jgi:hypothetical protein